MSSSESRKAIKAIKHGYGGPTHTSVTRALSSLVGLVRANVEDCRANTMESFFQKHKAQLSWVRKLDDHTITRLYQSSVAPRVNLKCLRQDLPIEGPNAAPVRAWQESPLTKAIDDLVETLNERFGRSFSEVAWDWGMKAADDTDWEASEEEQEDISDVDNDQNNDKGMDQEEDGIGEAMEAVQLD